MIPSDFDELADWLVSISSQFSPAELHGALIGGLAGAMRLSRREWTMFGLAVAGADGRLTGQQFDQAEQILGGLAEDQLTLLAGDDLGFQPFLPDDDYDLEQRTEEMSRWCKGFLGGFAEAQVYCQRHVEGSGGHADGHIDISGDELPANVAEALRDMAAIAQATPGGEDDNFEAHEDIDDEFDDDPLSVEPLQDESDPLDQEHAERDYFEVVEYLRLAALTVFTEYGWVEVYKSSDAAARSGADGSSKTLH